jgi:hypothetical protein
MLDSDLAALYGVETRVLKQAVRRNKKRFPDDFNELTDTESTENRPEFFLDRPVLYDQSKKFASITIGSRR